MKEIELTKGYKAIVDDEDFEKLNKKEWWVSVHRGDGNEWVYARSKIWEGGKCRMVRMHSFILDVPVMMRVDHINGNGLDNRRENLRVCNSSQNMMNKRKLKPGVSIYKGLSFHYRSGKWRATIYKDKQRYYLGVFKSEEEAARGYDKKALELFGEYAHLNFPLDKK